MSFVSQRVVIALGGNAISMAGEQGTIEEQFQHSRQTARLLAQAIALGYRPVLTHGNGPQVGNILRRVEIASSELYTIPLELCVADTQAGMGYMIAQCLMNELTQQGNFRQVTTVVTSVLVERDDPAFDNPSKPIGPRLSREVAEAHQQQDGWQIRDMRDGTYRRIVPSPSPREILEINTIRQLVESEELIICCGGGGIPVCRDQSGLYSGAAAVVDKDLTTALLACLLDVETMIILTSVAEVCLHFGTPQEEALKEVSLSAAQQYLAEAHFGDGSMRPKVQAAVNFLTHSRHARPLAVIGHLENLSDILAGKSGTRFIRD